MSAYLIATETVNDEAMFAEYRKQVVATVQAFGGFGIEEGPRIPVFDFAAEVDLKGGGIHLQDGGDAAFPGKQCSPRGRDVG